MHVNHTVEESQTLTERKSALGIRLFFIYLILYVGFVIIGVSQYELLSIQIVAGLNLALVYGIGLILFAIILGIVYNYFCTKYEDEESQKTKEAS